MRISLNIKKSIYVLQPQSCATKIFLKDVPRDVPMNQEVDIYLRDLCSEVPLICTFEGALKDGVRLTMLTGECVNDKINQLLIPGWKKENSNGNPFTNCNIFRKQHFCFLLQFVIQRLQCIMLLLYRSI